MSGGAGVFCENQIGFFENPQRSQGNIFEVSDGCAD